MMLIESGDDLIAVDCGLMFPDDEMPGRRLRHPGLHLPARAARRRSAASSSPTATRTTSARCRTSCASSPVPVYGTPLTLALARHAPRASTGCSTAPTCGHTGPATAIDVGAFARRADPGDPLDRRRHRASPSRRRSAPSSTPATSSSTRGRSTREQPDFAPLRGAGRARRARCSARTRPTSTGPATRASESEVGAALDAALRRGAGAHHPRHVRLAHPPHPAGARPGRALPAPGGAARQEHDGERGVSRRARLPAGARRALILPLEDLAELPAHRQVILSTGSQGEPNSALALIAAGDHKYFEVGAGRPRDLLLARDPGQRARDSAG